MLKIIVSGKELDLGSLKGISLKFNPGIFENDEFNGSYGIPFTLDPSDINNEIFGFGYKMGSSIVEQIETPSEVWHSGILMAEGVVKATIFTDKKITCNLYIDNGTLYRDFNSNNLNENYFGGNKPFVLKREYDYTSDDFLLYQVQNPDFYKDSIAYNITNNWSTNQNLWTDADGFLWPTSIPSIITPFPLLWKVLKYLFLNKGFQFKDGFFDTGDFRRITIFNVNNALTNDFTNNDPDRYPDNILTEYNLQNHLPEILTNDFINYIQSFFNIKFYISGYNVTIVDRKELIFSSEFKDLNKKTVGSYKKTLTGSTFDGFSFVVELDPDDANTSSLPSVTQFTEIIDRNSPGDEPDDPTPYLCRHSTYSFLTVGYSVFQNKDDFQFGTAPYEWLWGVFPYDFYDGRGSEYGKTQGYYRGKREYKINANITCVPMTPYTEATTQLWERRGHVKMKGNHSYSRIKNNFGLRLMVYQGMKEVYEEIQPFADDHYTDGVNTIAINANWSYLQRWQDYKNWDIETKKVEYTQNLQLNASEIKNFNFAQKKLINNNLFFITNMDVQLLRTSINPVKCIMIKAN